jgi:hypothetical protein
MVSSTLDGEITLARTGSLMTHPRQVKPSMQAEMVNGVLTRRDEKVLTNSTAVLDQLAKPFNKFISVIWIL